MRCGTPGSNDYQTYIRTYNNSSGLWGSWHALASIEAGTAVGNSTTPVYVNANGRITACNNIVSMGVQNITTGGTSCDDYTDTGIYYFDSSSYCPSDVPIGTNGYLIVLANGLGAVKQYWLRQGTPGNNDCMTFWRTSNKSGTFGCWWGLAQFEYTDSPYGDANTPVYISATGGVRVCGFSYLDLVNLAADVAVAKVNGTEMPDLSVLEAKTEEDVAEDEE